MADFGPGVWTVNRLLSAANTNATLVLPHSGQVGGWYLFNSAAYTVYLKLYNSATIPTAGAGTPVMTIGIPAGAGANVAFTRGISFSAGIGYTITKLPADNDATVVVANDLIVNLLYA